MEEIFQEYIDHQLKGIMLYEELSNCMDFLGLKGYKRKFEYYAIQEMAERKHFNRYYINHYSRLLKENNIQKKEIIPSQYYNYNREDITKEYKVQYIKESLLIIREYYVETIKLLNRLIKEIINNNIQDMCIFKNRLECYSQRLKYLDRHLIHLDDIGYNIDTIETIMQPEMHNKYKEKIRETYHIDYC